MPKNILPPVGFVLAVTFIGLVAVDAAWERISQLWKQDSREAIDL
jgi:hypothetical protein